VPAPQLTVEAAGALPSARVILGELPGPAIRAGNTRRAAGLTAILHGPDQHRTCTYPPGGSWARWWGLARVSSSQRRADFSRATFSAEHFPSGTGSNHGARAIKAAQDPTHGYLAGWPAPRTANREPRVTRRAGRRQVRSSANGCDPRHRDRHDEPDAQDCYQRKRNAQGGDASYHGSPRFGNPAN